MKRGFKQLFSQDRMGRNGEDQLEINGNSVEVEQQRRPAGGFFQKFFRPSDSRTSSPADSPHLRKKARELQGEEDEYAEFDHRGISNERELEVSRRGYKEKREMSVPVSPKSVKFEDEVSGRRGQSAAPWSSFFPSRTTSKVATYSSSSRRSPEFSLKTAKKLSWREQKATSSVSETEQLIASRKAQHARSAEPSQTTLDEATRDLLRLSSQPAPLISYSGSSRLQPAADLIQKSASTSSMNKVIRTQDGGLLKLANVFTWDAERLSESRQSRESSPMATLVTDSERRKHEKIVVYNEEKKDAPPEVKTVVVGKLKMEKIVGADLISIDQCVSSGWTIRDTVTHYKVKTSLGSRTMILEERNATNGEESGKDFKISVYESGVLKSRQDADVKIPENMSKAEYLSYLSQRLLRDMEKLEQDEQKQKQKTVTRIEVEVIEDVTKLLKTYIIGERAELKEIELDQGAVDACDEFTTEKYSSEHATDSERTPSPLLRVDKSYVDSLEREEVRKLGPADIKIQKEGQHFRGESQLVRRKQYETDTSVEIEARKIPRCSHLLAECELSRTEDSSANDVIVAMPNVFSHHLTIIRERIIERKPDIASYDIKHEGKQFKEETTIHRITHFETAEDEPIAEAATEGKRQATECELHRTQDSSTNSVVFAVPRTEALAFKLEYKKIIERESKGGAFDLEQQGQHFEDETILKKTTRYESTESLEEEAPQIKEAEGRSYEVQLEGQSYQGQTKIMKTHIYESTESEEEELLEAKFEKKEEMVREPLPASYELELLGRNIKDETLIKKSEQFISSELAEEGLTRGTTYVDLVKKSSRGEFEALIVISNDLKASETRVRECIKTETINAVSPIAREGQAVKTEMTVPSINIWKETFSGKELAEEAKSVMVAIQNVVREEEKEQETSRNLYSAIIERIKFKVRECTEEQAMTMFGLQSEMKRVANAETTVQEKKILRAQHVTSATEEEYTTAKLMIASSTTISQETQTTRSTANVSKKSLACLESSSAQTSSIIYLQNKSADSVSLSADALRKDKRTSSGHKLNTVASLHEEIAMTMGIRCSLKYGNDLYTDKVNVVSQREGLQLTTQSISEEIRTANFSLNQGAKSGAANVRLRSALKQTEKMNVIEFGNEVENITVMMHNTGSAQGQTAAQWAESLTGRRSKPNRFALCVDEEIDLTTVTTSKFMHLSNFKTLLPMHGTAKAILPLKNRYFASSTFLASSGRSIFAASPMLAMGTVEGKKINHQEQLGSNGSFKFGMEASKPLLEATGKEDFRREKRFRNETDSKSRISNGRFACSVADGSAISAELSKDDETEEKNVEELSSTLHAWKNENSSLSEIVFIENYEDRAESESTKSTGQPTASYAHFKKKMASTSASYRITEETVNHQILSTNTSTKRREASVSAIGKQEDVCEKSNKLLSSGARRESLRPNFTADISTVKSEDEVALNDEHGNTSNQMRTKEAKYEDKKAGGPFSKLAIVTDEESSFTKFSAPLAVEECLFTRVSVENGALADDYDVKHSFSQTISAAKPSVSALVEFRSTTPSDSVSKTDSSLSRTSRLRASENFIYSKLEETVSLDVREGSEMNKNFRQSRKMKVKESEERKKDIKSNESKQPESRATKISDLEEGTLAKQTASKLMTERQSNISETTLSQHFCAKECENFEEKRKEEVNERRKTSSRQESARDETELITYHEMRHTRQKEEDEINGKGISSFTVELPESLHKQKLNYASSFEKTEEHHITRISRSLCSLASDSLLSSESSDFERFKRSIDFEELKSDRSTPVITSTSGFREHPRTVSLNQAQWAVANFDKEDTEIISEARSTASVRGSKEKRNALESKLESGLISRYNKNLERGRGDQTFFAALVTERNTSSFGQAKIGKATLTSETGTFYQNDSQKRDMRESELKRDLSKIREEHAQHSDGFEVRDKQFSFEKPTIKKDEAHKVIIAREVEITMPENIPKTEEIFPVEIKRNDLAFSERSKSGSDGSIRIGRMTEVDETRVAMLFAGAGLEATLLNTPSNAKMADGNYYISEQAWGTSSCSAWPAITPPHYGRDDHQKIEIHSYTRKRQIYNYGDEDKSMTADKKTTIEEKGVGIEKSEREVMTIPAVDETKVSSAATTTEDAKISVKNDEIDNEQRERDFTAQSFPRKTSELIAYEETVTATEQKVSKEKNQTAEEESMDEHDRVVQQRMAARVKSALQSSKTAEQNDKTEMNLKCVSENLRIQHLPHAVDKQVFAETEAQGMKESTEMTRSLHTEYRSIVREASVDETIKEKCSISEEPEVKLTPTEAVRTKEIGEDKEKSKSIKTEYLVASEKSYDEIIQELAIQEVNRQAKIEVEENETFSSALFEQVGRKEGKEGAATSFATAVTLQRSAAFDLRSASATEVEEEIRLQRLQDAESENKKLSEAARLPEEAYLSQEIEVPVEKEAKMAAHNKGEAVVESTISYIQQERTEATYDEFGDERSAVSAGWENVLRDTIAEVILPSASLQQHSLLTHESEEHTVDICSILRNEDAMLSAEKVLQLKELAEVSREWKIRETTLKGFEERSFVSSACEVSATDKVTANVIECFPEFIKTKVACSGFFTRLDRPEPVAYTDRSLASDRKAEAKIQTSSVTIEEVEEQVILEKSNEEYFQEVALREKILAESKILAAASTETKASGIFELSKKDDKEVVENLTVAAKRIETTAAEAVEIGDEQLSYFSGWETVVGEKSTERKFYEKSQEYASLETDASREEKLLAEVRVFGSEMSEQTEEIFAISEKSEASRVWKISVGGQEKLFEKQDSNVKCERVVEEVPFELSTGKFAESEFNTAETVGDFKRLLVAKSEKEEASITHDVSRKWEESFKAEASKEEFLSQTEEISLPMKEGRQIFLAKDKNFDSKSLFTAASSEQELFFDVRLQIPEGKGESAREFPEKQEEKIVSGNLIPTSVVQKSTDAAWMTVINEHDAAVKIDSFFKEYASLYAKASQETRLDAESVLRSEEAEAFVSKGIPLTPFSSNNRQFEISEERTEKLIERKADSFLTESVVNDINRAESIGQSLAEVSEEVAHAGVVLLKHAAQKTSANAEHVVKVNLTLMQYLKAQHVHEETKETCAHFFVPSASREVRDTFTVPVTESAQLQTYRSSEMIVERSVTFASAEEELGTVESTLRASNIEKTAQKMRESDLDAFEILSEWKTIYRDLEAEAKVPHVVNLKGLLVTVAPSEEDVIIDEDWKARQEKQGIERCFTLKIYEKCKHDFSIVRDHLNIKMEKFPKTENTIKYMKAKRYDAASRKVRETSEEKLNAVVNIHRVSNVRPKQTADEYVWADHHCISAKPLSVKCEAAESDFTALNAVLSRPPSLGSDQLLRITANTTEPVAFECEEAGNEKIKIVVDIFGKQLGRLATEKIWPEANNERGTTLDTEEFEENQAALFAQMTSQQATFADCEHHFSISKRHEPLMLSCKGSSEESVQNEKFWEIPQQEELVTHIVIIPNKGEDECKRIREPEDNFVSIWCHFAEEEQSSSIVNTSVEARFGGEYQITTPSSKQEHRNMSVTLTKRLESEAVRKRLVHRSKSHFSLQVNASSSESVSLDLLYEMPSLNSDAVRHESCARVQEPVAARYTETLHTSHTVYAQFRAKQSRSATSLSIKLPNYGGHFALHTDSAEETIFNGDSNLRKDESFAVTAKTLKHSNFAERQTLSTSAVLQRFIAISQHWIKEGLLQCASLEQKEKTKGENVTVKIRESSDIKVTNYQHFSKDLESDSVQKLVCVAHFGGAFRLKTDASEDHQLDVSRQIESDRICVAHCSKLFIDSNRADKIYFSKHASKSETTRTDLNLQCAEESETLSITVKGKNFEHCRRFVIESEEEQQVANLNYSKPTETLISEQTTWLPRNGGKMTLFTKATSEERKYTLSQIIKERITDEETNIIFYVPNSELTIPLQTKQSEVEVLTTEKQMSQEEAKATASTIIIAANKAEPMQWSVYETMEKEELSNYHYKRLEYSEYAEINIREARYGGTEKLNKKSATDYTIEFTSNLVSARERFSQTKLVISTANSFLPQKIFTKASATEESSVTISFYRDFYFEAATVIQKIFNVEKTFFEVRESTTTDETMATEFHKIEESSESDFTVKDKRFGGSIMIQSNFAKEEEISSAVSLSALRMEFGEANVTNKVINVTDNPILGTEQAKESATLSSHQLSKPSQLDRIDIKCKAPNVERVSCKMQESITIYEIINIEFHRMEERFVCDEIVKDKLFGGSVMIRSSFAKEEEIFLAISLNASRVESKETSIAKRIANITENPVLHTQHAVESSIASIHQLNKSSQVEGTDIKRKAPNVGEGEYLTVNESTFTEETTNVQYYKNASTADVSEVIRIARYGGAIELQTNASKESAVSQEEALKASRVEHLGTVHCITVRNEGMPTELHTLRATELSISVSVKLQKASGYFNTSTKRAASRKGDNQLIHTKESTEINEYNNIQMSKKDYKESIEKMMKEARFGGKLLLKTTQAEKFEATVTESVSRRSEVYEVTVTRGTPNKEETIIKELSAAKETEVGIVCAFCSIMKALGEVTTVRITFNKGIAITFHASESTEVVASTTMSMQKPAVYKDISKTMNEKRYGGGVLFACKAAREENAEEIKARIQKSSQSATASLIIPAANEDAQILDTSASVEEVATLHLSLTSTSDQHASTSSTVAIAEHGGRLAIKIMQTEETVFNADLFFQNRTVHEDSQSYGEVTWTICEGRKEIPQRLETKASQLVEVTLHQMLASQYGQEASTSSTVAIADYGGRLVANVMQAEETVFNADLFFRNRTIYEDSHSHEEARRIFYERRKEASQRLEARASQLVETEVTELQVRRRLAEVHVESVIERSAREITPVRLQTDHARETVIRTDEHLQCAVERHHRQTETKQSLAIIEREEIVCAAPVRVELRHEEEHREELKEEKSEKRVSFAADVTEKTMTLDMSMTVERREGPSIIKKPMKKESKARRSALKMNEAPSFIPVRKNSLLMAMNIGSPHNIPHFKTLQDVIQGIKKAGLEYSNLIFGIDYTKSNYYQGEKTFDGRNLHSLDPNEMNPYQQVIEIVGKTLSSFDADGVIPTYGFGDEVTGDHSIFNIYDQDDINAECNGFEEVLRIYNEKTPFINMSGPTNFVPLIEKAVQIVREKQSYHILVIVADGQVTNEKINQKAIAAASHYPLSIIMVGVGDGPWNMMTRFDETLPKRMFDNFHFVDFHKVMFNAPNQEASFALNALMEIPDQYKAIKELGYLKHSRRG